MQHHLQHHLASPASSLGLQQQQQQLALAAQRGQLAQRTEALEQAQGLLLLLQLLAPVPVGLR